MQVFCLATNERSDMECGICGAKYALYFERKSQEERAEAMEKVREALEKHHLNGSLEASVHPRKAFNVPEWSGLAHMSGAALLGGAPPWAA